MLYAQTPEIIKPMLVFVTPSWLGATVKPIIGYVAINGWSGRRDSNPRSSAWQADALPTKLLPHRPDFNPSRQGKYK